MTASGPKAGLDWRRAGLGAAGSHKTRKVTLEVARCLAVYRAHRRSALAFINSHIIGLNLIISSAVYSE